MPLISANAAFSRVSLGQDVPRRDAPSSLPKSPFPRPSPQDTPEARLSPILRRRSGTRQSRAAPRLAPGRSGRAAALSETRRPAVCSRKRLVMTLSGRTKKLGQQLSRAEELGQLIHM